MFNYFLLGVWIYPCPTCTLHLFSLISGVFVSLFTVPQLGFDYCSDSEVYHWAHCSLINNRRPSPGGERSMLQGFSCVTIYHLYIPWYRWSVKYLHPFIIGLIICSCLIYNRSIGFIKLCVWWQNLKPCRKRGKVPGRKRRKTELGETFHFEH